MRAPWRRWRVGRRLSGLLEPGEEVAHTEPLGLGGWWVVTDRSLCIVDRHAEPTRLPFGEIRSVRVEPGRMTAQVTVTTATGGVVVGDLRRDSAVVETLGRLGSPPGDEGSGPDPAPG